jgi:hypothetical protein
VVLVAEWPIEDLTSMTTTREWGLGGEAESVQAKRLDSPTESRRERIRRRSRGESGFASQRATGVEERSRKRAALRSEE